MAANFHEQFEERIELPSDRSTGLVFAAASAVVAVIYYRNTAILAAGAALAVAFLGASFLAPRLLRPLNVVWFKLGLLLGKVVGPVVMGILFLLVIVPFGYFMRLRYDPLRAKIEPDRKSYWIERDRSPSGEGATASMKNQF